jgi:hypothetical protein
MGRITHPSAGSGVVSLGIPLGVAVLRPLLGEVLAVIKLVVISTLPGTALVGSQTLKERAFRLLRWLGTGPNHPAGC